VSGGFASRPRRPLAWLLSRNAVPVAQPFADDLRREELADALRRAGAALQIITAAGEHGILPTGSTGDVVLRHPSTPGLPVALRGWRMLGTVGLATRWLYRLALRERPAWITATSAAYGPALRLIKRRLGPAVVIHGDAPGLASLEVGDTLGPGLRTIAIRVHRRLERALFTSADLVTTVNDRHASAIDRLFSPRTPPVVVRDAADPIDPGWLPPVDLPALGVPPGAMTLIFVGQLMRHRLDPLFQALLRVESAAPVRALIVGDGPERADFERRVAASPVLRTRVVFLGYRARPEALALVGASDVAFSDCWSAGFPVKVFEYMASGRAMVVQATPSVREVLRHGEQALLYEGAGDLAQAISTLGRDRLLRLRLGRAALALFQATHTWDHRRAQLDTLLARHWRARDETAAGLLRP
jgi:glycosyltransferase involved in cell wall biosynthesis